jgi:hypothetical protein
MGRVFFPRTYGQPYADYPGTATFFSFVFARLFGAPNHLANVLPTALASAGVVALIYRLLAPSSRAWALLTVLLDLAHHPVARKVALGVPGSDGGAVVRRQLLPAAQWRTPWLAAAAVGGVPPVYPGLCDSRAVGLDRSLWGGLRVLGVGSSGGSGSGKC